jgi:hypothetical protein
LYLMGLVSVVLIANLTAHFSRGDKTMRYMLLIYGNESRGATMTEEEGNAVMAAYFAYGAEATAAGVHRSGEALYDTAQAKTVRIRNGKTLVTDGPFAETKEQLGGFYELQCEDLDEAILWAGKCPGIQHGAIEIRPIVDHG